MVYAGAKLVCMTLKPWRLRPRKAAVCSRVPVYWIYKGQAVDDGRSTTRAAGEKLQ